MDEWYSQYEHDLPIEVEEVQERSLDDYYPDWHQEAHCSGVGLDYYFGPPADSVVMNISQIRRAAKLCDVCPVYRHCLTHALTQREEYGVWAGTSGKTRKRIFKMLDSGELDIDEVIEVMNRERGQSASPSVPIRRDLPDETSGDVAL